MNILMKTNKKLLMENLEDISKNFNYQLLLIIWDIDQKYNSIFCQQKLTY